MYPAFVNYRESIDFLLSFADFERSGRYHERPDLAPLLALLRRLGDPHLGRRTVHIAGSKGKGSVAAMVESVLRASGLRTGLFTSPHLHDYTERIRIDGEPLGEGEWARLTNTLREAVAASETTDRRLLTFDLLTALAFLAFRASAVDVQVLECGLGGRLDSTNVFQTKEVCAITAIGLEHTDILGDTAEQIAAEKAGIITPGATLIIGPQEHGAAREVIRRAAAAAGCPVIDVAPDYAWRRTGHDLEGQSFRLRGPGRELDLRLPLLGAHQLENAATAVAIVDALAARGVALPEGAIGRGLASVSWPGRLEVLRRTPLVIADGAHSAESALRLRESLTDYFSVRDAFLIVGMSAGKDADALARELAPIARQVTAVRADHPRAMPPQEVAAAFEKAGVRAESADTVAGALDRALAVAQNDDVICLTGSLFVAAEGRARLQRTRAKA